MPDLGLRYVSRRSGTEYWGDAPHPTLTCIGVTWPYGGRVDAVAEVPPRVEHELTAFGRSLQPVLVALREWG